MWKKIGKSDYRGGYDRFSKAIPSQTAFGKPSKKLNNQQHLTPCIILVILRVAG